MTTIRANCPECGDVQLKVEDLMVRVCADDEQGAYTFRCPTCTTVVVKEASRRIVDLLVSSGAVDEVERSIERLVAESMRALDRADITDEARHALAELGNFVAWRDR